jgi:hypothetical protein
MEVLMKKVVISFIAGALLMASGQALADDISLIGKKVAGEATVLLNGKELSNAVIIDSKSYAPVRDITESFGAEVDYDKGVITIDTLTTSFETEEKIRALTSEKKFIEGQITQTQNSIDSLTGETSIIAKLEKLLETPDPNPLTQKEREEKLAYFKSGLEDHRIKLAELKDKLADVTTELEAIESAQ